MRVERLRKRTVSMLPRRRYRGVAIVTAVTGPSVKIAKPMWKTSSRRSVVDMPPTLDQPGVTAESTHRHAGKCGRKASATGVTGAQVVAYDVLAQAVRGGGEHAAAVAASDLLDEGDEAFVVGEHEDVQGGAAAG